MNKYLSNLDKWNKTEIERRFDLISERFLKIWTYPQIEIETNGDNGELNIFEADDPTHRKLDYAIFFDQKIEVNQVAKLYVEIFKSLFSLQPETFFTTEIEEKIGLTKNPERSKTRYAAALNDSYYIETGFSNKDKFDRIKQALTTFDFEDELTIKYAAN